MFTLQVILKLLWFNSFFIFVIIGCGFVLIKEKLQEIKETSR